MKYSFSCYGHANITARHKTTLEFTKDEDLRLEGDCIVGVRADFQLNEIKQFIKKLPNNKITITIQTIKNFNKKINNKNTDEDKLKNDYNKIIEKINAEINPCFDSDKEMVIRKTDFISERTFAIRADKAAFELNRDLMRFLKEKESRIRVRIEGKQ